MSGSIGINFGHLKIGTCDICVSNQVHRARCRYNTGHYNESQFINQVSSKSNPEVYTIAGSLSTASRSIAAIALSRIFCILLPPITSASSVRILGGTGRSGV